MVEINIQNLSPVESPIATTFLGVPTQQLKGFSFFKNGVGDTLKVVRESWGRGFSLCAVTSRGLGAFDERVSFFEPAQADITKTVPHVVSSPRMTARAVVDGVVHECVLQPLPDNTPATTAVNTWYGRFGRSQHVLYVWQYESDRAVQRFQGFVGTSDYTVSDTVSWPESIELTPEDGVDFVFDYAEQRGITKQRDGSFRLVRDDRFMHGQGFPFSGRAIFLDRALHDAKEGVAAHAATRAPVVGQVTSRSIPLNLLPFGTLPELHPEHQGRERDLALSEYQRTIARFFEFRGTHWTFDGPYTGVLDPRQTGSTETFGMVKLCPTLAVPKGFPAHLYALLPDIYSEAKRPSYFFEDNALPFMAALHPNYRPDGQGPHFHPGVNKDFLGKPPRYQWSTRPTGGWKTEDWAHSGSSIAVGLNAVLAGCALSRFLCFHDVQQYLTIKPGEKTFYQARGFGRSMLDIVYANIAVDSPELTAHLAEILKHDVGLAKVRERIDEGEDIVVYEIDFDGDPRKFEGRTAFWMPWSSPGLQLPGIVAAQWMIGERLAEAELVAMARTLVRHGCYKDKTGRWRVADAIVYAGPKAIDERNYLDQDLVRGGTYEDWVYSAVALTADRLDGPDYDRARAYCDDVRKRAAAAPPPRAPFARPTPFFAVQHPKARSHAVVAPVTAAE